MIDNPCGGSLQHIIPQDLGSITSAIIALLLPVPGHWQSGWQSQMISGMGMVWGGSRAALAAAHASTVKPLLSMYHGQQGQLHPAGHVQRACLFCHMGMLAQLP